MDQKNAGDAVVRLDYSIVVELSCGDKFNVDRYESLCDYLPAVTVKKDGTGIEIDWSDFAEQLDGGFESNPCPHIIDAAISF